MMLAWSFAARMIDEVARLLRALGKNRYVAEVDHRIHWTVDAALADLPAFAPHALAFAVRRDDDPRLEVGSRDPTLWRAATIDEVIAVLTAFWAPGAQAEAYQLRLAELLEENGFELPEHDPFAGDPEAPSFPELILLDWVLLAVDELDADQHAGALAALEAYGGEIETPSDPVYVEGPTIGLVELTAGAPLGVLGSDLEIWADGPFGYIDYLFRGVSKAAKLVDPPVAQVEAETE